MRVRVKLWLVMTTAGLACSSSDFLQSTLNKIQKERLQRMNGTNLVENTDYDGEIIFDSENDIDDTKDNSYESLFGNSVDQEESSHVSSHNQLTINNVPAPPSTHGSNEDEIQGYYYYFYPLDNYVQNLQENHGEAGPTKGVEMMDTMMDSMMKNTMMIKGESRVTPLFRAMTWFITTAMIFIVSILLMPRFRVHKAKQHFLGRSSNFGNSHVIPEVIENIWIKSNSFHEKNHAHMGKL